MNGNTVLIDVVSHVILRTLYKRRILVIDMEYPIHISSERIDPNVFMWDTTSP